MKTAGRLVARMVKVHRAGSLGMAVLVALASLIVLALIACGSSEPDPSADAEEIAAAVEKAVSAAGPGNRLTADEVRKILEDTTASRLTADDVQNIVNQSMGRQLTAADVQKILDQSAAGHLTAADIQKIVDASAGKQLTAADVQKAVQESAGGQLTAADVQKIVDASAAGQLTTADVQKAISASLSESVKAAEEATAAAAEAAQMAAKAAQAVTVVRQPESLQTTTKNASAAAAQESAPSDAPTAAPAASQGATVVANASQATAQSGPVIKQEAAMSGGPVSRPAPVSPPSATTFRDYERSRFASTAEDSVSTFSLDTDRTSFQLALNWARSGHAVEPDSVRAEEWINAFDYGYPPPPHQDSFAITTDVFTHPLDSRMHLVRLGFQAP